MSAPRCPECGSERTESRAKQGMVMGCFDCHRLWTPAASDDPHECEQVESLTKERDAALEDAKTISAINNENAARVIELTEANAAYRSVVEAAKVVNNAWWAYPQAARDWTPVFDRERMPKLAAALSTLTPPVQEKSE
jgi:predicted  nucleic acid-binding Zn-ribbon protein